MPKHDLVVIGAGPGGYVAAIRAAQLGLNAACVEEERALGGTCLRIGCIPSKALLEASELFAMAQHELSSFGIKVAKAELDLPTMLAKKAEIVDSLTRGVAFLFKKHGVVRYSGRGRLLSGSEVEVGSESAPTKLEAEHIVIATGSKSAALPFIEFDGERVATSTEALSYASVPSELVVIGAGVIGLELGSVWSRLGARVTIIEHLNRILPGIDTELAGEAQKIFEKQGMTFKLGCRVTKVAPDGERAVVETERDRIECDRVLVAVGRVPNTAGLGLEELGVRFEQRGMIWVDDDYRTSVPNIYAIGDVIRGPMLAHKASEEGVACVEKIATGYGHVNYDAIPNVVYTSPEIASVGKTEEELTALGVPFRRGTFPFAVNGRAKALGQVKGRIKVLAHAETDRILGVHILGPRAGEVVAEAAVAIEFAATAEDLARACHAHPTLNEVMKEAALSVHGRAIHL